MASLASHTTDTYTDRHKTGGGGEKIGYVKTVITH